MIGVVSSTVQGNDVYAYIYLLLPAWRTVQYIDRQTSTSATEHSNPELTLEELKLLFALNSCSLRILLLITLDLRAFNVCLLCTGCMLRRCMRATYQSILSWRQNAMQCIRMLVPWHGSVKPLDESCGNLENWRRRIIRYTAAVTLALIFINGWLTFKRCKELNVNSESK